MKVSVRQVFFFIITTKCGKGLKSKRSQNEVTSKFSKVSGEDNLWKRGTTAVVETVFVLECLKHKRMEKVFTASNKHVRVMIRCTRM